jgi:hypothetical protein
MNRKRSIIFIVIALACASGTISAKALLEKSIYFVNPDNGKIDSTRYWTIFLGSYPAVPLMRRFPGEDSLSVNSDLNLTVLSSGYIEGYGYTSKGRVDCMASFIADTGARAVKLPVDSIEYIIAGGEKVKPRNMPLCDLTIEVEGNKAGAVKTMMLTKYKLVVEEDERNLKPQGDVTITEFGFSRAALAAAMKAGKEAQPAK